MIVIYLYFVIIKSEIQGLKYKDVTYFFIV